jgi:hypothetical protein
MIVIGLFPLILLLLLCFKPIRKLVGLLLLLLIGVALYACQQSPPAHAAEPRMWWHPDFVTGSCKSHLSPAELHRSLRQNGVIDSIKEFDTSMMGKEVVISFTKDGQATYVFFFTNNGDCVVELQRLGVPDIDDLK